MWPPPSFISQLAQLQQQFDPTTTPDPQSQPLPPQQPPSFTPPFAPSSPSPDLDAARQRTTARPLSSRDSMMTQLMPSLFGLGAYFAGSPEVATGGMSGWRQGMERRDETEYGLADQSLKIAEQQENDRVVQETRRQTAFSGTLKDLQSRTFKNKADYDRTVGIYDDMLTQTLGMRPNSLRQMVPFNAPDVSEKVRAAMEPLIREHGFSNVAGMDAVVMIDTDDDGIPERHTVQEAFAKGGYAALQGPNGEVIQSPVKAASTDKLQTIFEGVLGEFAAEKKDIKNPVVRGKAMEEAERRLQRINRPPSAGGGAKSDPATQRGRALAELMARNPGSIPGLDITPTLRGELLTALAADPALMHQYETSRIAPVRTRATEILTNVQRLIEPKGNGYVLKPGAQALFGEWTPVEARDYVPGAAAADANAALKQILGQQIVALIADMKSQSATGATGFGALSLRELNVLEAAATQLTQRMSEQGALGELLKLKDKLELVLLPSAIEQAGPGGGSQTPRVRPAGVDPRAVFDETTQRWKMPGGG